MDPHNLIITKLESTNQALIHETADLLQRVFFANSTAWPTFESALAEVEESFDPGRISLVAQNAGKVLGWIGGIEQYDGHVYELHPLVVDPLHQRRGIGTELVRAFEQEVRARGAVTIWLGADDEDGRTSLSGIDLYPNVLAKLGAIQNLNAHPYEFYLKNGYSIVGVIPDANGFGKPDIYMAKRVGLEEF
jgi:aminoglycoside 6'-N-acetyltransferase I